MKIVSMIFGIIVFFVLRFFFVSIACNIVDFFKDGTITTLSEAIAFRYIIPNLLAGVFAWFSGVMLYEFTKQYFK